MVFKYRVLVEGTLFSQNLKLPLNMGYIALHLWGEFPFLGEW